MLALAAILHLASLITRSEAWSFCVRSAGATVSRRVVFRAAGFGSLASVVSAQLGLATRIAALRQTAPESTPHVPALLAAEVPIIAIEVALAAMFTFTLVGPLHLPIWIPILVVAGAVAALASLRGLARSHRAGIWRGLAALRELSGRERLVTLVILGAVAQIARNWLVLRAVGLHPSILDSIAVLIVTVSMSPIPIGAGVGATATVLILGAHGVAATAAGGVLLTVTGTAGALCFALWACGDHLLARRRRLSQPALGPVVAITLTDAGPRRPRAHGRRPGVPSRPAARPLARTGTGVALAEGFPARALARRRDVTPAGPARARQWLTAAAASSDTSRSS
jgi:hypothetical protein